MDRSARLAVVTLDYQTIRTRERFVVPDTTPDGFPVRGHVHRNSHGGYPPDRPGQLVQVTGARGKGSDRDEPNLRSRPIEAGGVRGAYPGARAATGMSRGYAPLPDPACSRSSGPRASRTRLASSALEP